MYINRRAFLKRWKSPSGTDDTMGDDFYEMDIDNGMNGNGSNYAWEYLGAPQCAVRMPCFLNHCNWKEVGEQRTNHAR